MINFIKSNKPNLIAVLVLSLLSIIYVAFLGWWYSLEVIFVPIIGGITILILLPTTVAHYFGKLRFVKLHKFMSGVDFFGIFGCALASMILSTRGYFIPLLICIMIVSLLAGSISFYQFLTVETPQQIKAYKAQEAKSRDDAVQKLRTLKQLLDEGAISEEEYNEKKRKYIDLL